MNKELLYNIKQTFVETFKDSPLMVFSPGRINIIGEHTDYNDGYVLPAAINHGVYLAIQKSKTDTNRIISVDMNDEIVFSHSERLRPVANGGWKNYVLGIFIELRERGFPIPPINILFGGDIPIGSGLSSSAAVENSVIYAIHKLFNLDLDKNQIVSISQKAEHNSVGVNCGIMDQYSSIFGKKNHVLFLDCYTIDSKSIYFEMENHELLLINSNVKHNLAENAYNERRETCNNVSKKLNIPSLRFTNIVSLNKIKSLISNDSYNKALFVIEENNRVKNAVTALENNDINSLGQLLFESHKGLKDLYEVSCDELDFLVDQAKKHQEVIGARMMGGGFGGCTINIVEKNKSMEFFQKVSKEFENKFGTTCIPISVKISDGTRQVF